MSAGAASSNRAHLWRALPSLLRPSPSPTHLPASTLIKGRRGRQPRSLRAVGGKVPGDRLEQALGRECDLVHRPLERHLVPPRGLAESAHLAHELPCRGADLVLGGDHVSLAQGLDASAHATTIRGPGAREAATGADALDALGAPAAPGARAAPGAPGPAPPASASPPPAARNDAL